MAPKLQSKQAESCGLGQPLDLLQTGLLIFRWARDTHSVGRCRIWMRVVQESGTAPRDHSTHMVQCTLGKPCLCSES